MSVPEMDKPQWRLLTRLEQLLFSRIVIINQPLSSHLALHSFNPKWCVLDGRERPQRCKGAFEDSILSELLKAFHRQFSLTCCQELLPP